MPAQKHLKQAASPATYACDYTTLVAKVALIGATTTYAYDPFGSRISQTSASSTTWYPNNFVSITNATVGSTTATSTDYVYGGSTLFETVDQPLVNGVATGTPVVRYIHQDNLGSTNITSDANQNRAQWFDYAPYGSVIASTNTGTTTDARQFIGQFSDASGLSYLNARYYNATQGQFTSEDPVALGNPSQLPLQDPQQLNLYSYARNNPLVLKDPSGRCLEDGCVIEAAGIGAIAGFAGGIGLQAASDISTGHLSSFGDYAVSGTKGAAVGIATAGTSAFGAAAATVGVFTAGATGISDYLGNRMLGQQTDWSSVGQDSLFNGLTGGAFEYLPGVAGRLPDLFSESFFTGSHAQNAFAQSFVGLSAQMFYTSAQPFLTSTSQSNGNHSSGGGGGSAPITVYQLLQSGANQQFITNNWSAVGAAVSQYNSTVSVKK
jgi:RHS repeat-associated protein